MNAPLALYCKSYRTDLKRVVRLAESIKLFNVDQLPFYVSVPTEDVSLFVKYLNSFKLEVLDDKQIISCNSRINQEALRYLPGHLTQQIVKSEFWRLDVAPSYMCLDSDAVFIRPFSEQDFLWSGDFPYTVIDEGQEFLSTALASGRQQVVENFRRDALKVQHLFARAGKTYSFGPFPLLWHRAVWASLEREYLLPRNMNLMDAIIQIPVESHWYGEALLKYQAIPLMPCQPLFKVYHYAWQLDQDKRRGIKPEQLSKIYAGAIYQSAWERNMDWPNEGGNILSRTSRRLRRCVGRI